MSLDKAIKYDKEKRKPYKGAKAVASSCRNHGGEDWSLNDRVHKYRKTSESAEAQIEEWAKEIPNSETIAAIEEVEEMKRTGNGKRYKSVEELFADLDSENLIEP